MDPRMLDGNAIAGLLLETFGSEMTTAITTCAACAASEPVGAVHLFRGAGMVLRCPHCESVLAKIVTSERGVWLSFVGMSALEIPRDAAA
jgi:hypothetical protein